MEQQDALDTTSSRVEVEQSPSRAAAVAAAAAAAGVKVNAAAAAELPAVVGNPLDAKQCGHEKCTKDAVFSYRWPWTKGDDLLCCPAHRAEVEQTAANLERVVPAFSQLIVRAAPLTRDERTLLIAAKLSAEAEMQDVQAKAGELYKINTEITEECRRLRARNGVLEEQVKEADRVKDRALAERDKAQADYFTAKRELERVKLLDWANPEKGGRAVGADSPAGKELRRREALGEQPPTGLKDVQPPQNAPTWPSDEPGNVVEGDPKPQT